MKIIIFDGSFKTTPFINRLIKGLVHHGHQVTVIGFNEHNPNPIANVTYQGLGSNVSRLQLLITSLQLALSSKKRSTIATACKLLLQGNRKQLQEQNLDLVFKKLNPDIVHLQWPSLLPWMEAYMLNKQFKVVLSQRGYHTNVRPFVDEINFKYLQKWYPRLDGIHSVSKAISKQGNKIGSPYTQIEQVIYTGLELDKFNYKPITNKTDQQLKILSVGRPHWKKDYPTALKACVALKNKSVDFKYTIVGGKGNEELLFLINELALQDTVTLTGKIPQEQVYKKMRVADVLLLPSIEEGIANVAVEAMALGLPVISTNCGGMEELIGDGKEGWIVPLRNSKALALAVIHLKKTPLEQVNRITLAAREKVEQQHSKEQMVLGMERLYKKVMEE